MSPAGKALANRVKRGFMKMYPDARVGIDGRNGFITVNGKKAVNMSQASGRPMSEDEMIDQMHRAYAETHIDDDISNADSRMETFRESAKMIRIKKQTLLKLIAEQVAESLPERPEEVEATEDAWAGGDNLELDVDYSKVSAEGSNVASPEVLDLVVAEVRKRIQEMQAHSRGDLGANAAGGKFPIAVGYKLNGKAQSEIAYDQEELDEILDFLNPMTAGGEAIPYSLNPLDEKEPMTAPAGRGIEQYMEAKDQNKDGKNDFEDVKIARMKASGMTKAEIEEEDPELFESTLKTRTAKSLAAAIKRTMGDV